MANVVDHGPMLCITALNAQERDMLAPYHNGKMKIGTSVLVDKPLIAFDRYMDTSEILQKLCITQDHQNA